MRKLLSVALVACFIGSFAYGKTENNNKSPQVRSSCVDYEIRLKRCNSFAYSISKTNVSFGLICSL